MKKIMPGDLLDKFEVDRMYWVFFMKYKRKLRYRRFLEEFRLITRTWLGCQGSNYMNMFYYFVTKEGIVKGRGIDRDGTYRINGKNDNGYATL